jgi:hypothetical protein
MNSLRGVSSLLTATLTVIPPTPVTVVGGIFEPDKYGFGLAHQSDLTRPWPWSSSGLTKMVWWRNSAQDTLVIDPEAPARQPTACRIGVGRSDHQAPQFSD